jgi:hypothetical protein
MKNIRNIGVLFKFNGESKVTLIDSRSKNRFIKLIQNWVPDGGLICEPEENQEFSFISINEVLDKIEKIYKEIQNTPAVLKVTLDVMKLINIIRIQNNIKTNEDVLNYTE